MKQTFLIFHAAITKMILCFLCLNAVLLNRNIGFNKTHHLIIDCMQLRLVYGIIFQFTVISLTERVKHTNMLPFTPEIFYRFLQKKRHTAAIGSLSVPFRHGNE